MSGLRPKQAELSINTDMSKTEETRSVIEGMVDGLNDHRIADIGEFFSHGFSWMGNTGCGTKKGLKEFQNNWQKPFQAAFSEKVCIKSACAHFLQITCLHTADFMHTYSRPDADPMQIKSVHCRIFTDSMHTLRRAN